jgi:hypothetical protein
MRRQNGTRSVTPAAASSSSAASRSKRVFKTTDFFPRSASATPSSLFSRAQCPAPCQCSSASHRHWHGQPAINPAECVVPASVSKLPLRSVHGPEHSMELEKWPHVSAPRGVQTALAFACEGSRSRVRMRVHACVRSVRRVTFACRIPLDMVWCCYMLQRRVSLCTVSTTHECLTRISKSWRQNPSITTCARTQTHTHARTHARAHT